MSLQNGLIAYYSFSGNANDESGNGNDGVAHNVALTEDRFGNPNSAYNFSSSSYVIIPHSSLLSIGSSDYSISVWINFDRITDMRIFSHGGWCSSNSNVEDGYFLKTTSSLKIAASMICSDTCIPILQSSVLVTNKWYLITLTVQRNNDTILYIDNNVDRIVNGVSSCDISITKDAIIGSYYSGIQQFYGLLDNVRIYNRSLSAEEVQQLYAYETAIPTQAPTILPEYYPDIDLATLNPNQGIAIYGAAAADKSGISVSSAGDINGDGYDDIIIGAYLADPYSRSKAGTTYVLYGGIYEPKNIDLESFNNTQGFAIHGANGYEYSGYSVSFAGDVNNDGYGDVIIGAYRVDVGSKTDAGAAYVIYGNITNSDIDLALLTNTQGFAIYGNATDDEFGISVSSAGDINGDGFDDIIAGARYADPDSRLNAGAAYIVYGGNNISSLIELENLEDDQGIAIYGESADYKTGAFVSGIGDTNADGYDDVIIGANYANSNGRSRAGISYVIYGHSNLTTIDLSELNHAQGFIIQGASSYDYSGVSVSYAGDVNNDGFNDFTIGAHAADPNYESNAGITYVIYGSNISSTIDLSSLNFNQGVKIYGEYEYDNSGWAAGGAGDFNGDGYDDIVIGANRADPLSRTDAGKSYIVYGGANLDAVIELSALNCNQGFAIYGVLADDRNGYAVSGAGDVNGDGYDDVIVGSWEANPYSRSEAGTSYLIYGFGSESLNCPQPTSSPTEIPTSNPTETPTSYPTAYNYIINPGAETGDLSGWSSSNNQETGWGLGSGDPHIGGYYFATVCSTSCAPLSQNISLSIGVTYGISFWAKYSIVNNDILTVKINSNILLTTNLELSYTQYTRSFSASSTSETLEIEGVTSGGGIRIDDFYISEVSAANAVTNSGAEAGSTEGWTSSGWVAKLNNYYLPHSGSWSFATISSNCVMSQSLTIASLATYKISLWSRSHDEPHSFSINIDSNSIITLTSISSSVGYTFYSADFIVSSSPVVLEITTTNDGVLHLDDLSVVVAENQVNNAGAELDMLGWISSGTDDLDGWIAYSDPHSGSKAFLTRSSSFVAMNQTLYLQEGATYKASFWTKSANSSFYELQLIISDNIVISLSDLSEHYIKYSASFTARASTEILQIKGKAPILVDDIIVNFESSPSPTYSPTEAPTSPTSFPTILPNVLDAWCLSGSTLLVGDFNGDGRDDLLCNDPTTGQNQIMISIGRGFIPIGSAYDETGKLNIGINSLWCGNPAKLLVGDFNGDGKEDLWCRGSGGNEYFFLSNGNNFIPIGSSGLGEISIGQGTWCISTQRSAVGDFNGDGKDDLWCNDDSGNNQIMISTGSTFNAIGVVVDGSISIDSNSQWCTSIGKIFSSDFDNDNKSDLLCHNEVSGQNFIMLSNSSNFVSISSDSYGYIGISPSNNFCVDSDSGRILVGDFNGDNKADLWCNFQSNGNNYVMISFGSSFSPIASAVDVNGRLALDSWCYGASSNPIVGDFDGDGKDDLACNINGVNSFAFSNGNSFSIIPMTFSTERPTPAPTSSPTMPARDLKNINLGTLSAAQGISITGATAGNKIGYSVSSAGDVNGDGYDDIVIGAPYASSYSGRVYVIYGGNSITDINLASFSSSQGFYITGISTTNNYEYIGRSVSGGGDINGDGYADIIIGAYTAELGKGKCYVIYGGYSLSNIYTGSLTSDQGSRDRSRR
jgi:hypothetical protein